MLQPQKLKSGLFSIEILDVPFCDMKWEMPAC